MSTPHHCPLCRETYDTETDLRVHLEVEHRKSELAQYLVDTAEERTDPAVENEAPTPTA